MDEVGNVQWEVASDSELRPLLKTGRPRDSRFDTALRRSADESCALRAVVDSRLADEITRGLKRGALYHNMGVRVMDYYTDDDDTKAVVEFIAWRRPKDGE